MDNITIAIIAGLCSFMGAVVGQAVGQLLSRNTQREKWLLQKRSEVFSKFLLDVNEYDNALQHIENTCGLDSLDGAREQATAFNKILISESIVCFYLSDGSKKEFRKLVDNCRKFVPDFDLMVGEYNSKQLKACYQPLYDMQDDLQKLLEENLSKISWYK